ncbi:MAG: hypothetical protein K9K66_10005 [Desulfarculaceae bacterium]|nr:hypothetical protein [Desulfarculaceae bacterium]MCF8073742.1 hypothetical protein [Desulfarculaceae bacterium]MCF8101983.1 hypothetical protein [Desulfarculaceae bacterium]MCF8115953.1 hypothetical protein [Desulfarculaceae bacterium]
MGVRVPPLPPSFDAASTSPVRNSLTLSNPCSTSFFSSSPHSRILAFCSGQRYQVQTQGRLARGRWQPLAPR